MAVAVPLVLGAAGYYAATAIATTLALSATGVAVAGAVGFSLGSSIGSSMTAPGGGSVEGPRATDNQIQQSSYGRFIPIVYGTAKLAGNVIWSSDIREVRKETRSGGGGGKGGGGGGGGTTVVTYSYYCSWALGICEGPVTSIHRIWFDADLVYEQKNSGVTWHPDVKEKMTFYAGTDLQDADPLMQGFLGMANVPAYRGLCYLIFSDVLLEKWANRIPNVTVELSAFPKGSRTSKLYPQALDEKIKPRLEVISVVRRFQESRTLSESLYPLLGITAVEIKAKGQYEFSDQSTGALTVDGLLVKTVLNQTGVLPDLASASVTIMNGKQDYEAQTELLPEAASASVSILGGSLA
jgi:hypothetical protein